MATGSCDLKCPFYVLLASNKLQIERRRFDV